MNVVNERSYTVGGSTLTLRFGDLTRSPADVLVSSDDSYLSMGGGVSGAILRAGGQSIMIEAAKRAPARLGGVVVTTAGALPAKHVFHAITIGDEELESTEVIAQATRKCLDLLDALELRSIAFPAIGAGVAGFSYEDVAVHMAETIVDHVIRHPRPFEITIYLYDRFRRMEQIDFLHFFEEFAARSRLAQGKVLAPPSEASDPPAAPASLQERKKRLKELAELDRQRELIELRLAQADATMPRDEPSEIRRQLEQIHTKRVRALADIPGADSTQPISAFISYAHEDESFRLALGKHLRVLERQQLIDAWHDRRITAGAEWSGAINASLSKARLVLLLISPDFTDSPYCYDIEMKQALEQHEAGETLVIPIIVRPVMLKGTPFARLQSLPQDAKPIILWPNADLAYINVVEGVQRAIEESRIVRRPR